MALILSVTVNVNAVHKPQNEITNNCSNICLHHNSSVLFWATLYSYSCTLWSTHLGQLRDASCYKQTVNTGSSDYGICEPDGK